MTATPVDEALALWHGATHPEEWPAELGTPVTIHDSGELYPIDLVRLWTEGNTSDAWRGRLEIQRENRRQRGERYEPRHRAKGAVHWTP